MTARNVKTLASEDPVAARLEEAANWFAELEDGVADHAAFERWRADPANAIAFNRVSKSADRFETDKNRLPDSYVDSALVTSPERRSVLMAGLAVLGASLISTGTYLGFNPPRATAQTRVGGRSSTLLPDGSRLELNTESKAEWRYSDRYRTLWLDKGEIALSVAPDPRPLRIQGVGGQVLVESGEVIVRRLDDHMALTVLGGRALVSISDEKPVTLVPGQQLVVDRSNSGLYTLTPEQLDAAKAWQSNEIVFLGEPLDQAVSEYNRYLTRKIVLAGDGLSTIKLGGRFTTRDPQDFLAALKASFDLKVQDTGTGDIVLSR